MRVSWPLWSSLRNQHLHRRQVFDIRVGRQYYQKVVASNKILSCRLLKPLIRSLGRQVLSFGVLFRFGEQR